MTTRTVERIYNGVTFVAALIVLAAMIALVRVGDVAAGFVALLVLCLILFRWLDVTQARRRRRRVRGPWCTGEIITAAQFNTEIEQNINAVREGLGGDERAAEIARTETAAAFSAGHRHAFGSIAPSQRVVE